jgi:hypothetical protein
MNKLHRLLLVCIGLTVVCGGNQLNATETIFAGVPVYSFMDTVDTDLSVPVSGANAFTPRNILCPAAAGANGCTFRVTVSVVIQSVSPDAILQTTTAPFMTVSPAPVVHIAGTTPLFAPITMQWVIRNVPAGTSPEVQVTGGTASGVTILKQRTESIDVFYGFI